MAIWGSTWLAITFQLGRVAPEASVGWRFLLASLLLFAFCLARRLPLRYTPKEHAWIALQGMLMFSVSYIYVYYAEENVSPGSSPWAFRRARSSRCWACASSSARR